MSSSTSSSSSRSSSRLTDWSNPSSRQLVIGGAVVIGAAATIYGASLLLRKKKIKQIPYRPPSSSHIVDYSKVSSSSTSSPEVDLPHRRSQEGTGSYPPYTVFDVFNMAVRKHGDKDALRVERDGQWISWTWKQCKEKI